MSTYEHTHEELGNCQYLLSSLGEYVDGVLSDDLCAELEEHMKGCKRCQIVVNTLKKTIELYHETSADVTMPDMVRQRLYKKLNLEDFIK